MHTDCATLPGMGHLRQARPSQDFALHGQGPDGLHWALVADGCSTGGATDLGARIWALAARKVLQTTEGLLTLETAQLQHRIINAAEPMLDTLDFADGFATLGLVLAQGERVRVLIWGDGEALALQPGGELTWKSVSFTHNAPLYLNYLRHPVTWAQWRDQSQDQRKVVCTASMLSAAPSAPEAPQDEPLLASQLCSELRSEAAAWEWRLGAWEEGQAPQAVPQALPQYVLVSTDGVHSCSREPQEVVRELASIRGFAGEFLKRRMGKLWRVWSDQGRLPTDDLTVAGVVLQEAF